MNVENFFNDINEKNWRSNISAEASRKVDEILKLLSSEKEEIVADIVDSISKMESLKIEEKEEFIYSTFKKWLNRYSKDYIIERIG